jgi:mono/diheme cytochrome c family protein
MLRATILLTAVLAAGSFAVQSGQAFKPGKLPPEEKAALAPGLTLRFYAKAGDAKALDARRVRLAALRVPKDTPPTPFLPAGPFHARITGYLKNPLKGSFTFRLSGTGTMSLRINDKEVLKNDAREAEVELAKNYNRVEIVYASPAGGDATVRLDWSGEKFGFEPVPPEMLFARKDDADLVEKTALREGRELFANLHCASCHEFPAPKPGGGDAKMPEMYSKAPKLDGPGSTFESDWLTAWIINPRALRPEATMPRVLSGPDAGKQAADIAAYLGTLKMPHVARPLDPKLSVAEGEAVFKRLGCITCHRLDDPSSKDELGRLSLHFVAAKYAPEALAYFLKEPHQRYPWTRMPDFKLSQTEVDHLDKFLREKATGKVGAQPKGDAARGAKLFQEVGCARCHATGPGVTTSPLLITKLQAPEKGCLAEAERGKAPDFSLSREQRAGLQAILKTEGESFFRETPAEFSLRQVKALQCNSCHRRDGEITRWHAVLEDEGKVPENLPSLTWVGEKLKPAWTKKLFAGESDHKARPWIKGRMPAFPARADMLAVGLSHEHGFGINEDDRPKPDAKLAAIGAKLIPQQGGFNCINCHGIGRTPPIQPFEAPGINLRDAALRLRYAYYQRWMLAPDRVDVTMRMPVFAPDGKTTQIREPFDGDARKQYDALWQYIQTLPNTP